MCCFFWMIFRDIGPDSHFSPSCKHQKWFWVLSCTLCCTVQAYLGMTTPVDADFWERCSPDFANRLMYSVPVFSAGCSFFGHLVEGEPGPAVGCDSQTTHGRVKHLVEPEPFTHGRPMGAPTASSHGCFTHLTTPHPCVPNIDSPRCVELGFRSRLGLPFDG